MSIATRPKTYAAFFTCVSGWRRLIEGHLRTCLAARMIRQVPVFDHSSLQEGKKPGF
jgi:hypothetical protein